MGASSVDRTISRPVRASWVICALSVLAAPVVFAEAAPDSSASNQAPAGDDLSTVVVTGTHILQSSAGQAQPVQNISSEQILQSCFTDVSSVLQNIPQSSASLTNSAQSNISNGRATPLSS